MRTSTFEGTNSSERWWLRYRQVKTPQCQKKTLVSSVLYLIKHSALMGWDALHSDRPSQLWNGHWSSPCLKQWRSVIKNKGGSTSSQAADIMRWRQSWLVACKKKIAGTVWVARSTVRIPKVTARFIQVPLISTIPSLDESQKPEDSAIGFKKLELSSKIVQYLLFETNSLFPWAAAKPTRDYVGVAIDVLLQHFKTFLLTSKRHF